MNEEEVILTLLTVLILSGVSVLWLAMYNRQRIRQMAHRERLAMIERGLMPPPEVDPAAFERKSGLAEGESPSGARAQSAGVVMIGFGFALIVLLAFAADVPEIGAGVGGAFALLGAAFYVNGAMMNRRQAYRSPVLRPRDTRSSSDREAPPNVAP